MSWHYLIKQIIDLEQREIALYRQIAAGAPTPTLRNMILQMAEHEQHEINCFWQRLLQGNGYMPGDCHKPKDGYLPSDNYLPDYGYSPYEKKEK